MSTRLFQTVIASSVLLLSGTGTNGCASYVSTHEAGAERDVLPPVDSGPTDASTSPDAALARDVIQSADESIADALADTRAREAGWPTTKGVYCVTPDVGPAYCCRYAAPEPVCFIPTEPDGSGPLCTVDSDGGPCTPCGVAPDASMCPAADASAGGN